MFAQPLKELSEHHLVAMCANGTQESNKIEFKRELYLSSSSEKAEAAKDVSAMANGVGGRIFFGIAEKKLPDKTTVAASIEPLADGSLPERLENVLVDNIHPVPRKEMHRVQVNGGYVLVVEVYPSFARDLHMVSGFKQHRFYRRGEYRTIPMSEPEVREAYLRIAASRYAIEHDMNRAIERGQKKAQAAAEFVFVVPIYGRPNLIDPRQFGDSFGLDLYNSKVCAGCPALMARGLRVVSGGYEYRESLDDMALSDSAGVYRNGVVHFSTSASVRQSSEDETFVTTVGAVNFFAGAVLLARHVLNQAKYWGPVRIIHFLRMKRPFYLASKETPSPLEKERRCDSTGYHRHEAHEVFLENPSELRAATIEILDQFFQTGGYPHCPWFDASGREVDSLPRDLARLLS